MPRPRLCRRISYEPKVNYFKPAGIRLVDLDETILTVDEYEAVKLKDLQGLEQEEAAKSMNISQPTFHRLILSARKKVADAIVNGKAIKIEGGNYTMRGGRGFGGPASECVCPKCGHKEPKERGVPCISKKCPKCSMSMVRGD
jgi:predicted DNA-binding protein (UPF0251 family)